MAMERLDSERAPPIRGTNEVVKAETEERAKKRAKKVFMVDT